MNPKCSDHFFSQARIIVVYINGSWNPQMVPASLQLQLLLKDYKFTNHITHKKARYKEISIATLCILLTISYYPLIFCICLQYQMIKSCSLVTISVCVTIWMPKSKDGSRQKYERCRCHEFSSASFCQLSVFTPFMNKSSISKYKHPQIHARDWRTWEPCHLRLIGSSREHDFVALLKNMYPWTDADQTNTSAGLS